MFVEIAKAVALVFCILSLYAVFHSAFLSPAKTVDQRLVDSLAMLALAAGISVVSGLIFREGPRPDTASPRLRATLPVQMFCWAAGVMAILFLVSWYLETYCVFYRDIRF